MLALPFQPVFIIFLIKQKNGVLPLLFITSVTKKTLILTRPHMKVQNLSPIQSGLTLIIPQVKKISLWQEGASAFRLQVMNVIRI